MINLNCKKMGAVGLLLLGMGVAGCATHAKHNKTTLPVTKPVLAATKPADDTLVLFDGKSLTNWKVTEFGGEGEVEIKDGSMKINMGATLSGVTWSGKALPKNDYVIEMDAMKLQGQDFFVGLTFPVQDSHASLILGGWGGGVCGISSINGNDASANETTCGKEFKKNVWYRIRMEVTTETLKAWIDSEKLVDVDIKDKKISTRVEIDGAIPFGVSTYQTTTLVKNITIKPIK